MAARRVTVMSPQTRRAHTRPRRHGRRPARVPAGLRNFDTAKALRNYRSQRRRAIVTVAVLTAILVGLPVVLDVWPLLDRLRLADIPVSWLALAVLPYPLLVVVGVWHLHRAEAIESSLENSGDSG